MQKLVYFSPVADKNPPFSFAILFVKGDDPMNAKKRYDVLINQIEAGAHDKYLTADELMFSVAKSTSFSPSDLSSLLNFMTGQTLRQYIRQRKLMAAYQFLIEADTAKVSSASAISTAVAISGYDNQNSFTKRFSSAFLLSPKEAYLKKDFSLLTGPATWDVISGEDDASPNRQEGSNSMNTTIKFGISQDQYERVLEAHDLELLYGFSPAVSQAAFDLSEQLNLSLKDAFAYTDSLQEFFGDMNDCLKDISDSDKSSLPNLAEMIRNAAVDPYVQFIYFSCGLSASAAFALEGSYLTPSPEELMKQDPHLLRAFLRTTEMSFSYFKAAYMYYTAHADSSYGDDCFNEYLDLLHLGWPKEEAFDHLLPSYDNDDFNMYEQSVPEHSDLDDFFEAVEQEVNENARWNNVRIDMEFDEENFAYEQDDFNEGPFDF